MSVLFTRRGPAPAMGKPASDFAVGDSVFLNVGGLPTEFLVVHQGKPSGLYDDSCDGTWLLAKDLYEMKAFSAYNNDYENSEIHAYLNGIFLDRFAADIKAQIKQVKLPYHKGTGSGGSVSSGANGLSTKIFLLSGYEVGWTASTISYFPVDGASLSYFSGTTETDPKRIGYYDGSSRSWWLRSPYSGDIQRVWTVYDNGGYSSLDCYSNQARPRPALILPHDAKFDPDTNVIL